MILSNTSIHEALDKGWIKITPEPTPRQSTPTTRSPYQTSAVDLRLGNEISFFKTSKLPLSIDLRRGSFASLFAPYSENIVITQEQPFTMNPGKLVLGKTLEQVSFPILSSEAGMPSLAARVEGKSSFARCGLLVHFTAPTIHAGFAGTITLELINMGPLPILLYPEMPICQLIIEQVHGSPVANEGQFQGQNRPAGAI